MVKFTNKAVAELLRSIAAAYLLKNENRFKIIAYDNAADTVEHMNRELHDIWEENGLRGIPGIGPSISQHLNEYFSEGKAKHFDEVLKGIPASVFVLMKIPLIGPKRAFKLVKELKLLNPSTVIEDLKKASLAHRVAEIPSFGEKSEEDILLSIQLYEQGNRVTERMPLPYAFSLAEEVLEYLKRTPGVKRVDALGSLRRMVATIGDIDIAVVADDKDVNRIIEHFTHFPRMVRVDNAGGKKASIIVSPNIRVDLRIQDEKTYGTMLQYFTGSKAHNIKLREYALKKKLSISEYGVKRSAVGSQRSAVKNEFKDEESFYDFLGLQFIPPEIREGTNEIEIAKGQNIPNLVKVSDIKGDLHVHSSYDLKPSHDMGANTYEEMLKKAISLKYNYIGFSEHNPKTGGNSEKEIVDIMKKRKDRLEKLREKYRNKIEIFIGLEVDILPNGKIALPDKAAQYVDYLIASIHSSFRMNESEMTDRVLKGLSHDKVKVFGHPTTRLLGKRESISVTWDKVFELAKERNIALEINSGPERLDLPDTLVRSAKKNGNIFMVDTDAHASESMEFMFYGVSVARRGWLIRDDIVNTMEYNNIRNWLIV